MAQPPVIRCAGKHVPKGYSHHQSVDENGNILLAVICSCDGMVFVPQVDVLNRRTLPCPDRSRGLRGRPLKVSTQ